MSVSSTRSDVVYSYPMTKVVQEAIDALKELPREKQETVARAILDYASDDGDAYHLTDEERREVRGGLSD